MIKSMTGFGRCEICEEQRKITVEMKSVNHRYLDVSMKMPKKLNFFEASIRGLLKEYIQRGKVDIFLSYEDYTENNVTVRYNRDVAAEYVKYLKEMADEFSLADDIRISTLARFPEVFTMEEKNVDEEGIWKALEKAVRGAAQALTQARVEEGENLKKDLLGKLDGMLGHVGFIEERSPQIVEEYRLMLENKVKELAEKGEKPANIARFTIDTIMNVLLRATAEAQRRWPGLPVLCSGGVASNRQIRAAMEKSCGAVFAQPQYATDNALGVAILTHRALERGVQG